MGYKNQWITALNGSFMVGIGMASLMWPTSVVEVIQLPQTPLARPATAVEASLVGSLSSIGGMLGTPLLAYLFDRIGRKRTATISGVLLVVMWALMAVSRSVELVLTALFLSGVAGSGMMLSLIFVTEVASSEVRGRLGTMPILGSSLGMLMSFALGGYVSYQIVVFVHLALSVLYVGTIQFSRESPIFFLQRHDEESALAALAFYRELPIDSKQLLDEFYIIKNSMASPSQAEAVNTLPSTPEQEKLKPDVKAKQTEAEQGATTAPSGSIVSTFRSMCRSRASRRAFVLCMVLTTVTNFMGMNPVMVYASVLFGRAAPDMPAPVCSMLLAIVMLLAGIFSATFSDRFGRKMLMVVASGASGAFTLLMATQLHVGWAPDWLGIVLILAFTFVFNFGPGVVPFLMLGEVFAPEVRALASMLVLEWLGLINFALLFAFAPLVEALTMHGVFYAFSAVCWATVVYSMAAMPETKGLEPREIVQVFERRRSRAPITSPRRSTSAADAAA